MAEIPDDDLDECRAALAPMLDATAAILPWVAKPRPPRFDARLNERWCRLAQDLAAAWSNRHGDANDTVRPAIFALYAVAVETADIDCLQLGEALASATDRLEGGASPALVAALSATIECLTDPGGLEHEAFGERARHFSRRIAQALSRDADGGDRSPVLDRLFVDEASERIAHMRDALAALPLDAYAFTLEAGQIAQQAEYLELFGIAQLARQLMDAAGKEVNPDALGQQLDAGLRQLCALIAAVDA